MQESCVPGTKSNPGRTGRPGTTGNAQFGRQVSVVCLLPSARVRAEGEGGRSSRPRKCNNMPAPLKTNTLSQTQIPSTCFGRPSLQGWPGAKAASPQERGGFTVALLLIKSAAGAGSAGWALIPGPPDVTWERGGAGRQDRRRPRRDPGAPPPARGFARRELRKGEMLVHF